MLLGLTIEQVNDWPAAIAKVTAEDIKPRRRQVSRHPPLGDRLADPDAAGARERPPSRKPAADKL